MAGIVFSIVGWGSVGCVLFTALLLLLRTLGVVDAARDPEGRFKRLTPKSVLGFASVLVLMVGFPALGALSVLQAPAASFWSAWAVAYGIYFVINLYDFVVIDYLILVRWHPEFLNLPDTDYYRTTRPHAEGFVRGSFIGVIATALSAALVMAFA